MFPSQDTEDVFATNEPIIYTVVVVFGFASAALFFLWFSYAVERRQRIMIKKVVENAERVTATERGLNEFLAHEVRNPFSAAISACSFVTSAVNEREPLKDSETQQVVREDIEVVSSSLTFINDFLRGMLDIHRANGKKIQIEKSPTDVLRDILEPISAISYNRMASFEVNVECPENLIVMTDNIRLKQVILNLVHNASKFVARGFIRMRADIVDHEVRVLVEDSGPGIREERRAELFSKYQESLDLLNQGTGLGLNLSKTLMHSMGGDLWLDETYHSGVEGSPGACFVVQLNSGPIDIEMSLPSDTELISTSVTVSVVQLREKQFLKHQIQALWGTVILEAPTPGTIIPEAPNRVTSQIYPSTRVHLVKCILLLIMDNTLVLPLPNIKKGCSIEIYT